MADGGLVTAGYLYTSSYSFHLGTDISLNSLFPRTPSHSFYLNVRRKLMSRHQLNALYLKKTNIRFL
jgi:hypothetical protein